MKYTKGPWKRHDMERNVIVGEDHKSIADVDSTSREDEENQANARLIAAAPELLEALRLWQLFWDKMPDGQLGRISCDIGILNDAFIKTRQAIAKAEEVESDRTT